MNNTASTILIVDDIPENLRVAMRLLLNEGFRPLIAKSGEQALEVLAVEKVDLILLDIMMPGMDGFDTCRAIKKNPQIAHVPIIFLTALNTMESVAAGFEAGGSDYVLKPIQRLELLARVKFHLDFQNLNQFLEESLQMQREKQRELEKQAEILDSAAYRIAEQIQTPLGTLTQGLQSLREKLSGSGDAETVAKLEELAVQINADSGNLLHAIAMSRAQENKAES